MKMLKRVLAGIVTTVMMLTSVTGVFAAGSRTNDATVAGDSVGYYKITIPISDADAYKALANTAPEVVKIIDAVNAGEIDMEGFADALQEYAAGLSDEDAKEAVQKVMDSVNGTEFVTDFFDLIAVGNVKRNANGNHEVTMNIPSLTEKSTDVKALHYSDERDLWEVLEPKKVDLEKKTITVEFEDLSPVAIIAKQGTVAAATDGTQVQLVSSPKTEGVASTWMMWIGAAFVLVVAGFTVVCRRKNYQ